MRLDRSRNDLLTDFGKATLTDRYLLPGEDYQDLFARVASAYADDPEHAQRLYDYMSRLWFMPATPILSNGGTERGLPISCFLNTVGDTMEGIAERWNENVFLASQGGGLGTYYGDVRSIGEPVRRVGKTSGVVSFLKVNDSLVHAVSQGSLRRGSGAIYLPVWHPEIEEFIDIRRATGGDPNRKCLNLHHGVVIDDEFMRAVRDGDDYDLRSPRDGGVLSRVSARAVWSRLLTTRIETGEPYLLFIDTVNDGRPEHQKRLGLRVKQSNLCTEITLPTGPDHYGQWRTAVCCLSSLNLETWDQWCMDERFIEDVMRFLDNVLQDFIDRAGPHHKDAVYAAKRERSVGLGVMGFHSLLQKKGVSFESEEARTINELVHLHIKQEVDRSSLVLAKERGPCPDAADCDLMERFSNKTAIAPTASISTIAGGTSAGIEPWAANAFVQKTLSGSFAVRNPYLERLLEGMGQNTADVWQSIFLNHGSVQHLPFLSDEQKAVFKTALEIDQTWVIRHAADRADLIDQAQSVNLFLRPDASKQYLHTLHWSAWELGVKSLYYLRSISIQRAEAAVPRPNVVAGEETCEACQ